MVPVSNNNPRTKPGASASRGAVWVMSQGRSGVPALPVLGAPRIEATRSTVGYMRSALRRSQPERDRCPCPLTPTIPTRDVVSRNAIIFYTSLKQRHHPSRLTAVQGNEGRQVMRIL